MTINGWVRVVKTRNAAPSWVMRFLLLFIALVWARTSQQEAIEVALCGCIGCCKAAPPICCPATCPKCLRPGEGRGGLGGYDYYGQFPKGPYPDGVDNDIPHPGSPFEPAWVEREYPAPPANCPGGSQCPCNGCVCCYTATIRYTQETTCISSETETMTSTITSFQPTTLVTLVTESSTFIFTVENMVRFIETTTDVVLATDSTVTVTETFSSFTTIASSFTLETILETVDEVLTLATRTASITSTLRLTGTASTLGRIERIPVTAEGATNTKFETEGVSVTVDRAVTTVSPVIGSLAGTFTRTLKTTVTPLTATTIDTPLVGEEVTVTEQNVQTIVYSTSVSATQLVVLRTRTPWSTTVTIDQTPTVVDPTVSVTCTDTITTNTASPTVKNERRTLKPGESYDPRVVVQVFD